MDPEISLLLQDVIDDRVSGAALVTRKAAALISRWAGVEPRPSAESLLQLGRMIIQGQPSMAPIINLVNDALQEIEEVETDEDDTRARLIKFIEVFTARQADSIAKTVEASLPLIQPGDRLATHSYSTTVRDLLLAAARREIPFELVLTEGRPNMESRALAVELGDAGVKVEFVTDMGLFALLDGVKRVFVGADAVARGALVNKAGTCAVAARCRQLGIHCYALLTGEKLLAPALEPLFQIVEHDPEEVWPDAPGSVKVRNIYFDLTPVDALSGLACEQGLLRPSQVVALIRSRPVSRLLTGTPA